MTWNDPPFRQLRKWLLNIPPGNVVEADRTTALMASCWHDLVGGNSEGMHPGKLPGRVEGLHWEPPVLSFTIERHGGTALGSTRAELQRWEVDTERRTAQCQPVGYRQVRPRAEAIDVKRIAIEIAERITSGNTDPRIIRQNDGTVRIHVAKIFPSTSGFKQTIDSRRRRFREALKTVLSEKGWRKIKIDVYQPAPQL